jgi:peroxiredoxin
MMQGTETLRQPGLAERCLSVGDTMPAFALPNATGQVVNSADLLAQGPLVVSFYFYRGGW